MRVSAILIASLSALAAAQGTVKDATEVASSLAAAATAAANSAKSHNAAIISSQVAGQTLSGAAAAAEASHNAAVLSSALAAQTSLKSHIKSAEASVLSEASLAKETLASILSTATGKFRNPIAWYRMHVTRYMFFGVLKTANAP